MIYIGPAKDGSNREEISIEGNYRTIAVELMHVFMILLEEGTMEDIELFAMVKAACESFEEKRKEKSDADNSK